MAQSKVVTIEEYMQKAGKGLLDAFAVAWKETHPPIAGFMGMPMIQAPNLLEIQADVRKYLASPRWKRWKPDYVLEFERMETDVKLPTLSVRAWHAASRL